MRSTETKGTPGCLGRSFTSNGGGGAALIPAPRTSAKPPLRGPLPSSRRSLRRSSIRRPPAEKLVRERRILGTFRSGLAVRGESRPRAKVRDFSSDQGAEPQEYREYFKVWQRGPRRYGEMGQVASQKWATSSGCRSTDFGEQDVLSASGYRTERQQADGSRTR